jgi:hypothetical protein
MIEFEWNGESKWTSLKAFSKNDAEFRFTNWMIGKGEYKITLIEEC